MYTYSQVGKAWPVIEDPASHTYIRPEGAGLMVIYDIYTLYIYVRYIVCRPASHT